MAKGYKITNDIEVLIAETYNSLHKADPKVTAKEVRAEVETRLKQRYEGKEFPPDWPGVSAVGKVITKIHKEEGQAAYDPLDTPWSLGCLAKHEISAEALPAVMRVYEERLRTKEQYFTIREAMWVARLYRLVDDTTLLDQWASVYAVRNQVTSVLELPIETRDLDTGLMSHTDQISPPFWNEEMLELVTEKMDEHGYDRAWKEDETAPDQEGQ